MGKVSLQRTLSSLTRVLTVSTLIICIFLISFAALRDEDSAHFNDNTLHNEALSANRIKRNSESANPELESKLENNLVSNRFKRKTHHHKRKHNKIKSFEIPSSDYEKDDHRHQSHQTFPYGRKGDLFNFNINTGSSSSSSSKKSKKKDSKNNPKKSSKAKGKEKSKTPPGQGVEKKDPKGKVDEAEEEDDFWMPPVEAVPLGVTEAGF